MRSARKVVAAMHQGHLGGEIREIERLLDGGIAAADHHDLLAAEEEAVASGACRYAEAPEALLGGNAEPFGARAGRDDERVGGVDVARITLEAERPRVQIRLDNVIRDQPRPDMGGLQAHLLHEPGPLDDIGESPDNSRHPW